MIAGSYPLLDVFWTMLEFFALFIWIYLLIMVFADIIRSHDLSGGMKALWTIAIVFLPLIGVLIYLIARGDKMHERQIQQAQAQQAAFRNYVKEAAADDGAQGTADQLATLADLRDRGIIDEEEFQQEKAKALNS